MDFTFFDKALSLCLVALAAGTAFVLIAMAAYIIVECVAKWNRR